MRLLVDPLFPINSILNSQEGLLCRIGSGNALPVFLDKGSLAFLNPATVILFCCGYKLTMPANGGRRNETTITLVAYSNHLSRDV